VAGVLEEAEAVEAEVDSLEGISRLERSSPSSARMAINLPTGTPAAPLPTCGGGRKVNLAPMPEGPTVSSPFAPARETLKTHEDLSHDAVVLGLDVDGSLVGLDREEDVSRRERFSLLDLPLGDAALGHGRRLRKFCFRSGQQGVERMGGRRGAPWRA
jgi:hypothetical protein